MIAFTICARNFLAQARCKRVLNLLFSRRGTSDLPTPSRSSPYTGVPTVLRRTAGGSPRKHSEVELAHAQDP